MLVINPKIFLKTETHKGYLKTINVEFKTKRMNMKPVTNTKTCARKREAYHTKTICNNDNNSSSETTHPSPLKAG